MHSLLFSPRSRTITKIYLPVNVPCLVNHWVVNLNNFNVPSLSNSIKVQTKVMLKNTFQANEYTIVVLYPHKLNNTSSPPPFLEKGQCMINTRQGNNKGSDSEQVKVLRIRENQCSRHNHAHHFFCPPAWLNNSRAERKACSTRNCFSHAS